MRKNGYAAAMAASLVVLLASPAAGQLFGGAGEVLAARLGPAGHPDKHPEGQAEGDPDRAPGRRLAQRDLVRLAMEDEQVEGEHAEHDNAQHDQGKEIR